MGKDEIEFINNVFRVAFSIPIIETTVGAEIFVSNSSKKRNKINYDEKQSTKNSKKDSFERQFTENPEIVKTLEEYFSSLERYLKSSFLRKYILSLRSISLEDLEKLEKKYLEIDVKTISFPFQSVELVKNMEQINMYILEKINNSNMKNEHSYILRELKKLIALKAHKEILEELKKYIKEKDENKWDELFNSEPVSLVI